MVINPPSVLCTVLAESMCLFKCVFFILLHTLLVKHSGWKCAI